LGIGTPEAQVFNAVGSAGISMAALKNQLGLAGDLGFRQGMQLKWVAIDKSGGEPLVVRKVESIVDKVLPILKDLASGSDGNNYEQKEMQALSKRRMVTVEKWKTFKITKGPKFALERKKAATDLTVEMLAKGTWKNEEFKEYNFNALGIKPSGGYLHPLLKVRTQFRKIFTNMGFQEMPTNNYVESSFWNFDALFQPQQHPARDAHDTFFLTSKISKLTKKNKTALFSLFPGFTFKILFFRSFFLQNLLQRLLLQFQLTTSSG
jgi:phenylalanyl-tRNA synthetase alpha chain